MNYEKYIKNNLPTPVPHDMIDTTTYVWHKDKLDYFMERLQKSDNSFDRHWNHEDNIIDALSVVTGAGFYYPYTCANFRLRQKDEDGHNPKLEIARTHAHSFSQVVDDLYRFPESFKLEEENYKFYSEQELNYLRRVQSYLRFIGLQDLKANEHKKTKVNRYRNKKQTKYGNAYIYTFPNNIIEDIKKRVLNYTVISKDNLKPSTYDNQDFQVLIIDKDYNFKLFIEFTYEEVVEYKKVTEYFKDDSLSDDDKVLIRYFKVLEEF